MQHPSFIPARRGCVYLVGAGPGDPDLLTVKAHRLLHQADIVVFDRLVPEAILALIPPGIAKIYAGKSCKHHSMPQGEINQLLGDLARSGKTVVRLKGGDPFLFGRGGEEAMHLAQRKIPFEIVPGVTSASGCSAYAGIPLTHRGLATGVRFLTGHRMMDEESGDYQPLQLDWKSLADPDTTLVIYMGLANLAVFCDELRQAGLDGATPAAAIERGTTPQQQTITSTINNLYDDVQRSGLSSPVLLILGRVAALSQHLAWFQPDEEGE